MSHDDIKPISLYANEMEARTQGKYNMHATRDRMK